MPHGKPRVMGCGPGPCVKLFPPSLNSMQNLVTWSGTV